MRLFPESTTIPVNEMAQHISEDELELYALGRLDKDRTAIVEEHILECGECLTSVERAHEVAATIREALLRTPAPVSPGLFGRLRLPSFSWPSIAWAASGVAAIAALVAYQGASRQRLLPPAASLHLRATRGDSSAINIAVETDITLDDAPSVSGLSFAVVDAAGSNIWNGPVSPGGVASIRKELSPGSYLIRLNRNSLLLHEYAFNVSR